MSSGSGLRGSARASTADPSWRAGFALGGAVASVMAMLGLWLRLRSSRPELLDLRLLYNLAGVEAVDAYLVGGSRGLLFALHLLFAVAVGGAGGALLVRLGVSRLRAALVVLFFSLVVQVFGMLPVA